MEEFFKNIQPEVVFLNKGVNSDSGLSTLIPDADIYLKVCPEAKTDKLFMHNILAESRVIKNDEEIDSVLGPELVK